MKKSSSLLTILIILLGFSSFKAFGQENNISFSRDNFLSEYVSRTWTAVHGLPGNSITDVIQDSTGYLYLGTYDGLVRFDGVEFITYNRNYDEKYGFVSSRTLFEDSNGNIWNGSNDEGLFKIDRAGKVISFTTENGLPGNSIRAITEDKEGNIWVGTAQGVVFINKSGNIEVPQGLEKFGQEKILVSGLYCDTAGRIWVLSPKENGVYIYVNKGFEQYKGLKSFPNSIITSIMQDKSTNFWVGVAPHYAVKIDGEEETVFDVGQLRQPGSTVSCIFQDRHGNMWFSLDTGVTVIHDGVYSHFDTKNGLSDDKVSKIIQDREGNIWFATDRGGVERLSPSKFKTTTMKTTINAISDDPKRNVVWLAGDDGLYCLKKNSFIENEITRYCKNIRIRDVTVCEDGTLLIATYEKLGEVIYSPDGKIKSVSKTNGLTGNKVRVSFKAKNGDIYVGTTSGVNIISQGTGSIQTITKADGIDSEYIMWLYEDSKGVVWCGTDGAGVFTIKDGKIDRKYSTENGLIGNVIFKIHEEAPGDFWFTTGTGISRLNEATGKIVNYNSRNGLGADGVFQAVSDYTRTVWMTSNKGIFSATIDEMDKIALGGKNKINSKFFGQSDGLISAGVTSTSKCMKDSLGRIWFTLIDGFAVYDPLNVTANKTAPMVKIEEITIDNEKFPWNGEKIILSPDVKRIGIKYTGLTFVSSERTQFKYKLDGFETEYPDWSSSRYVSYTNLKHGNYAFSVVAANSDGVVSENVQRVEIIKKPYIWELFWFWVIIVLLICAIVFAVIYRRFARMRKYQILLENAVQERTKELVAEEKKTENLLLNILPKDVAEELKEKSDKTIARSYEKASVMFVDIVGFTKMADTMTPEEIVKVLNNLVTRFDERAALEGVEKIKTIGDAYMAATGLSEKQDDEDVVKILKFAQGILDDVRLFNRESVVKIQVRIGVNTGRIIAGVIGKSKFIYDIWGDTVNVASRMQSSGVPGKISVTEYTYSIVKDRFEFDAPVEIEAKGKGLLKSYRMV